MPLKPMLSATRNDEITQRSICLFPRAATNLPAEDLARIQEIERTYRETAVILELMKARPDVTDEDIRKALHRLQLKNQ